MPMLTPIEKMTEIAKSLDDGKNEVFAVSKQLLEYSRFDIWSGSSQPHQHHYGKGGLAQHTLEVAELCLATNRYYKNLGRSCEDGPLFLAALFHDAGKMYDYQPVNHTEYEKWEGTKHKRLVHHITRSALMWTEALRAVHPPLTYVPYEIDVLHAILAHHGLRAYGSPVMPSSRLAWILHLCDGLSARVNDCETRDMVNDKG